MKGSSTQVAEGNSPAVGDPRQLQRDAITPPSPQGLYANSSQRRERSTTFPAQPCPLVLTKELRGKNPPQFLWGRETGAAPHLALRRSHGHHSAVSYSHKLQPSELQKTKISISFILIFLGVCFSSSRSCWVGAEQGCEAQLQPEDVPLSSALLLQGAA